MDRLISHSDPGQSVWTKPDFNMVRAVFVPFGLERRCLNSSWGNVTKFNVPLKNFGTSMKLQKCKAKRSLLKSPAMFNRKTHARIDCQGISGNNAADVKELNVGSLPPRSLWTSKCDQLRTENPDHCLRLEHEQSTRVVRHIQGEKTEKIGPMNCCLEHRNVIAGWFASHWNILVAREKRSYVIVLVVLTISLTSPSITVVNHSINIADNVAYAQPIAQIRQVAMFLERLAGGTASEKILDKVVTVISGQTVVTPETIEGLKSIIDGEKDYHDWQTDLADRVGDFWSTCIDVISNFNPLSLIESAGTSIQGLTEVAAERFAAFELSTLVALGERWLLWSPFIAIPMYIQMSRNRNKDGDNGDIGRPEAAVELSEVAKAKAVRVREELERIELKAAVLDLVYSLGKIAWQSLKVEQDVKRRQIDETLCRLQELNPMHTASSDLRSTFTGGVQKETIPPQMHPLADVDGEWILIYVSQATDMSQQQQLSLLPNVELLGIELSNLRQKVWHKVSRGSLPTIEEGAGDKMIARNTAEVRLGPLGVMEISVQGSWENLRNGTGALVSFDTFSARPIEVLGNPIREDLPPLNLSIPRELQTSGQWEVVYLDNSMRINKGRTGQLYLFRKAE